MDKVNKGPADFSPGSIDEVLPSADDSIDARVLKILLLEDVASDAQLIERELRKARIAFETRCVETRKDFLVSLKEFRPDIILSDYSMPGFNAMEAIHILNESPNDVPFILVTGSQSEEVAVQCMKEGVNDYILKSTLKRLPSAMINALRKKQAELERERAIEALQRSEEHFRSLIENAMDIIAVLNADGTFKYASPSVKILGYRTEDLLARSIFDHVSKDDIHELTALFQQALQSPGVTGTVEFLFRHQNGSWRVLEAICKGVLVQPGVLGLVLNARDVSERKQAEAAIEKLAAFPRLNPNPIFELTAEGSLSYCNKAAQEMAASLGKKDPGEILPGELELREIIKDCLQTGQSDLQVERTIANRILNFSFFPIIPSQVVHCYAMDMTERINLEAQLRQSQKMESIGQLAAGVAHDFNNILTLIQGYSGLMLAREHLEDDLLEPLQQVALAAERAANLTRQLLMFSRKQMMQTKEIDLNELIGNNTKFLRRILGEDIVLQFNYSPNLPSVKADSGMMEQVVMNLVVNARDAMPRGGRLTVGTCLCEINHQTQSNPEARTGLFVCLRVSDTGSGISPEVVPHIFEPFFTTKEIGKGTGLGLATVYGIAKQHQGWIEVLSEVGRGTTFRVYFPAGGAIRAGSNSRGAPHKPRGGNERILVVEDEPELRALVRDILRQYGYKVFEASSGPEALRLWEEHWQEIDMLLTDMVMPGNTTGLELAEILKGRKPELKVVYTSGYSVEMIDNKGEIFQRGKNFLQKPYQPLALVQVVRDCLDGVEV